MTFLRCSTASIHKDLLCEHICAIATSIKAAHRVVHRVSHWVARLESHLDNLPCNHCMRLNRYAKMWRTSGYARQSFLCRLSPDMLLGQTERQRTRPIEPTTTPSWARAALCQSPASCSLRVAPILASNEPGVEVEGTANHNNSECLLVNRDWTLAIY